MKILAHVCAKKSFAKGYLQEYKIKWLNTRIANKLCRVST